MSLILAISFLLFAQVAAPEPMEQGQQTATLSGLKGADLDLLGEVRRIGASLAELRGQEFERPPLAVRVPQSMQRVAAEIRAFTVLPPARLESRGRAWEDVGLGDDGTPARLMLALATDLDGVGFDPAGNRLLVGTDLLTVDDFEPEGGGDDPATVLLMTGVRPDETVVSHSLTHVWQRERTGADCLFPTTDAMLASMAWAEGEANLVAIRYLFRGLGLSTEIFEHRFDPGGFLDGILLPRALNGSPPVEKALLEFVFLDGFDYAVKEFRAEGWTALDRAMAERTSTRQMLHPSRSAPVSEFPAPKSPAPGELLLADEDVLGEQAIVVAIAQGTGKDNLGLIAGDGWAGGRLYRWESANGEGEGVSEWITRWDSEEAAADFHYSFARALAVRFPDRKLAEPVEGRRRLNAGERVFVLETRATEVRILVAVPKWAAALPGGGSAPAATAPETP